jgi:probable rRNA maturation factor
VETDMRLNQRDAMITVTFLGREKMCRHNADHKGKERPNEVLAFPLRAASGEVIGDVYICPWVARREAKARGIPLRQELIRLVIHGTLHALGRDHPEGPERTRSGMWRRQERYVEALA